MTYKTAWTAPGVRQLVRAVGWGFWGFIPDFPLAFFGHFR